MSEPRKTVLYDIHVALGARMVDFAGWLMPVQYPTGILAEHLATRKGAGLFDVSHMGRLVFAGPGATGFLDGVLTCHTAALAPRRACYAFLARADGGAIDDAFLYRFTEGEYLLVVNAGNADADREHLRSLAPGEPAVAMTDRSADLAMLSLQGPLAEGILAGLAEPGELPAPGRNALGQVRIAGVDVLVARTGYTGEPVCFELMFPSAAAEGIWELLVRAGATPVGLGARDTLRLEAGLPLYGHELGTDAEGRTIPIFTIPQARFGVSFAQDKGSFLGREALSRQQAEGTPRRIVPLALTGRGVARAGAEVHSGEKRIGTVTSGTAVPYWKTQGQGPARTRTDEHATRSIALAMLDRGVAVGQEVEIDIRGRRIGAVVVRRHLDADHPPQTFAELPSE